MGHPDSGGYGEMSKAQPPADEDDGWIDPPPPLEEKDKPEKPKGFWGSGRAFGHTRSDDPEPEEDSFSAPPASGSWIARNTSRQLDKKLWHSILHGGLLKVDSVQMDSAPDEEKEESRIKHIYALVWTESLIIVGLSLFFVFMLPFGAPMYRYYARMENQPLADARQNIMIPLYMPNLTNRAVLSWAATSISEIMTFGFGDYEVKLKQQKPRFTGPGWAGFVKTFIEKQIGEQFQQRQLVVTTAPADTPVIVSQGENKEHIYEWRVQAPVIVTFATNNNVTSSSRSIVELTIVRVPHEHNASGIAINIWRQRLG